VEVNKMEMNVDLRTMDQKKYRKGWRNDYRAEMPLLEAIAKDVRFALSDFIHWIQNGFSLPVIVAFPDFPSKKTTLFKIAKLRKYRLTNKKVKNPKWIIYFEDTTYGNAENIAAAYQGRHIMNVRCTDISKRKVDKVHKEVFGYNTIIDPTTYMGIAVQKSDVNALHDGRVISCPTKDVLPGSVYQVLIDNEHDDTVVMDFRMPVVFGKIPFVYKKFKKKEVRFTNQVSWSEKYEHREFFTEVELSNIVKFAAAMGVDFCELDILRNRTDGRIYIIDVNKTPYGPPAGLPEQEAKEAIEQLSDLLVKE